MGMRFSEELPGYTSEFLRQLQQSGQSAREDFSQAAQALGEAQRLKYASFADVVPRAVEGWQQGQRMAEERELRKEEKSRYEEEKKYREASEKRASAAEERAAAQFAAEQGPEGYRAKEFAMAEQAEKDRQSQYRQQMKLVDQQLESGRMQMAATKQAGRVEAISRQLVTGGISTGDLMKDESIPKDIKFAAMWEANNKYRQIGAEGLQLQQMDPDFKRYEQFYDAVTNKIAGLADLKLAVDEMKKIDNETAFTNLRMTPEFQGSLARVADLLEQNGMPEQAAELRKGPTWGVFSDLPDLAAKAVDSTYSRAVKEIETKKTLLGEAYRNSPAIQNAMGQLEKLAREAKGAGSFNITGQPGGGMMQQAGGSPGMARPVPAAYSPQQGMNVPQFQPGPFTAPGAYGPAGTQVPQMPFRSLKQRQTRQQ